jgi:hypothetical protein
MKKEMIVKDEKYEIEYTAEIKGIYLEVKVTVNDIDLFEFRVSNYLFDGRVIEVTVNSTWRNVNIANAVFDDYFLGARNT